MLNVYCPRDEVPIHVHCLGDEVNPITFGFELEFNFPDGLANFDAKCLLDEKMTNLFTSNYQTLIYFKTDGSIGNGLEMISQPMSYRYFLKYADKFKELLQFMCDKGFDSHDNCSCGLHFHIGNSGLVNNKDLETLRSDTNLYQRLYLQEYLRIASNIKCLLNIFQYEFCVFSRRRASQINRWCKFDDIEIDMEKIQAIKRFSQQKINSEKWIRQNHSYNSQRYQALNVTNKNTIEIRLFRGTLNYQTFYYTFNLVNNIASMARENNRFITFEKLLFTGLNEEDIQKLQNYMNKQKKIKRGFEEKEFDWNTKKLFTGENKEIRKYVIKKNMERLGY